MPRFRKMKNYEHIILKPTVNLCFLVILWFFSLFCNKQNQIERFFYTNQFTFMGGGGLGWTYRTYWFGISVSFIFRVFTKLYSHVISFMPPFCTSRDDKDLLVVRLFEYRPTSGPCEPSDGPLYIFIYIWYGWLRVYIAVDDSLMEQCETPSNTPLNIVQSLTIQYMRIVFGCATEYAKALYVYLYIYEFVNSATNNSH